MEEKISKIWSDWKVVGSIGGNGGSGGTVYQIIREHSGYTEEAALKVISVPKDNSEIEDLYNSGYDSASISTRYKNHLDDIEQEYQLMNRLKGHTNIVYCDRVEKLQHEDGIGWDLFIKMELLTPLNKTIGFTEKDVVELGKDICAALIRCVQHNVIHRDIKPSNILLSKDKDYKLGDFGIARTIEQSQMTVQAGTPKFMAPEVYKGEKYDASVDIYSLGMVMYWMLNKRTGPFLPLPPVIPLLGQEQEAFALRLKGTNLPPPVNGNAELQKIVLKACAFRPEDRYASAAEMLRDLKSLDEDTLGTQPLSGEIIEILDEDDKTPGIFAQRKTPSSDIIIDNDIIIDVDNGAIENVKTDDSKELQEKEQQQKSTQDNKTKQRSKFWIPLLGVALLSVIVIFATKGIWSNDTSSKPNDQSVVDTDPQPPINDNLSSENDAQSEKEDDVTNQNEPEDMGEVLPQELVWSEWADYLPDFVYDGSYIVESKLQYRTAPRYDFFGSDALTNEYTVCYTGYGEWSKKWSGWSTTRIKSSDLVQVDTGTRYWYQNYVMWPTATWGVSERRPTDKTYSDDVLLQESETRERLKGQEETIYRYKSRSMIYFCIKNSEWSDFQDDVIPTSSSTVVNTRTVYRYAKKLENEEVIPSMDNFPPITEPVPLRFADVSDDSWYGANQGNWIGLVVDLQVMSANEYQRFRPDATLTIAELVKTAVSVRKLYNGDNSAVPKAQPWYGPYVDYAFENGIVERGLFSDYTKPATRAEAALILGRILPAEEYEKRNTVHAITDVKTDSAAFDSIWRLAESGVISWSNAEGTFEPERNITRAEFAEMIVKIAYPDLRA